MELRQIINTNNDDMRKEKLEIISFISPKQTLKYRISKRIIDIIGAIIAILIFSPCFVFIALAIKIEDPKGKIFFSHRRLGNKGKLIPVYKFRSMVHNAESILNEDKRLYQEFVMNGYKFEESQDPRITKIGVIIRKTSLDELPQFFNVLNGSMSLVGPRPIMQKEIIEYGEYKDKFQSVKPGITGLWQVSGRSKVSYPERCKLELEYVDRANFLLDIKILFLTVYKVIKREGAY